MSKDLENMSVTDRLKKVGVIVTNKKWGGWDNGNRMMSDSRGKELGFFTPLKALRNFKA